MIRKTKNIIDIVYTFVFFVCAVALLGVLSFINDYKITIDDITLVLIALIGTILAVVAVHFIVIKPKLRLSSVLISIIFFVLLVNAILLFYEVWRITNNMDSLYNSFELESLGEVTFFNNLDQYLAVLLISFLISGAVYLILSKSNSPMPIVVTILVILGMNYSYFQNYTDDRFTFLYLFTLLGIVGVTVSYFIYNNKVNKSESRDVLAKSLSLCFIILIISVSVVFGTWLTRDIVKRQLQIKDMKKAQIESEEEKIPRLELEPIDFPTELANTQNRVVGYYQAEKPLYLKTDVFLVSVRENKLNVKSYAYHTEVTGQNYEEYDSYDNFTPREEVKVIYTRAPRQYMPSPSKLAQFSSDTPYIYSYETGLIKPEGRIYRDQKEYVSYKYSEFDAEKYYSTYEDSEINNWDNSGMTKLNTFIDYVLTYRKNDDEILDLANEITEPNQNNYEKAKAVEAYLQNNFTYTLNPELQNTDNPINEFLFESKRGYCTYFAVSMALILDALGMDARVVGGFYSDTYNEDLEAYMLLSRDLHAWVEVYFPGYGWVTFDPTTSNVESEEDIKYLTGGQRELANYSPEDIDSILGSINSSFSFDDIRKTADLNEIDISSNESVNIDNVDKVAQKDEKKREEEKKDKAIEKRNRDNEDVKTFISRTIVATTTILLAIISLYGIFKLFNYLKDRNQNKDIKMAYNIDKKIRGKIVKRYNLPSSLIKSNSKEFLHQVKSKNLKLYTNLSNLYPLIDRILYSSNYNKKDITNIKKLAKKI